MAKIQEIGPYSAYAIAVKYGYQGTEEEWVQEQEANRKAAEAAAAAAAQSAKDAAASASGVAQSGQQAVQNIQNAQTTALQAIDTAKQQAVQAAQAEAEKALTSAGQAASSAAEAAQSATNAAAEVGKVQSAGTSAVQAVQAAQNTATEAVSAAQQTATQTVSEAQATAVSAVQAEGTAQTNAVASAASSALTGISGAKDAALSDVAEAGTAQVSAVGTAGVDAVEDVNDAKTAALEAIDAANAALPSPTQSDAGKVPTVKVDGSAYELAGPYTPLSAAIRPTASGNPVSITDSVEWPLLGLKVYGKSTQDGTPSLESLVPIVSAGDGGSIDLTLCGANLLPSQDVLDYYVTTNGTLVGKLSGNYSKVFQPDDGQTYYIRRKQAGTRFRAVCVNELPKSDSTVVPTANVVNDIAQEISLTANAKYMIINLEDETAFDELMVSFESNAQYEPYQSQSLTLSTPNGLPGIPVDSGGNFTDAEGQQLVCNYKDYARGVYMQPCALEKIVGTPNFTETPDNPGRYLWSNALANTYHNGSTKSLSTFGKWLNWGNGAEICFALNKHEVYFNYLKPDSADEVNALFSNLIETNQCYVLGQLVNPIETPLSEDEIAAYRALHTYDGTTVVSTAEDVAGLEVKYLADGEKYVERIVSQKAPEAAAAHTMALLADGIREGVNGV